MPTVASSDCELASQLLLLLRPAAAAAAVETAAEPAAETAAESAPGDFCGGVGLTQLDHSLTERKNFNWPPALTYNYPIAVKATVQHSPG